MGFEVSVVESKESTLALNDIIPSLDGTPAAYLKAAREVEHVSAGLRPLRLAVLSTFTAEFIRPYLVVEGARRGLFIQPYFGPFNQLEQQALDSVSGLYGWEPELVLIAALAADVVPQLTAGFGAMNTDEIDREIGRAADRVRSLIEGIRGNTDAGILVFNLVARHRSAYGLADASVENSQTAAIQRLNGQLAGVCRDYPQAHIFDLAAVAAETGSRHWEDARMGFVARMPISAEGQLLLGRSLARYCHAATHPPKKCLVLDLDNTLWGGVLGEDGQDGIELGEDYPGNVYKDFQRRVLDLKNRGILLAAASKNDEADVLEVLDNHPDCLLRAKDFAAMQVHWGDKASSLLAISDELNIGLDSLVFFDDNPVEREWVRTQTPEVTVIDVPDNPLGYTEALDASGAFDALTISAEDRLRSGMYEKEHERGRLKKQVASAEEFLRQLEIRAEVGFVNPDILPRAAQLLAKTNQFNLTSRRHTAAALQGMIDNGAVALWLRLSDRFGDSGLVGLGVGMPIEGGHWTIDTFLMSCRVLGREADTTLLSALSVEIQNRGGQVIHGEYLPTKKNGMVAEFYPSHGFRPADNAEGTWEWSLAGGSVPTPGFIDLHFADSSENGR